MKTEYLKKKKRIFLNKTCEHQQDSEPRRSPHVQDISDLRYYNMIKSFHQYNNILFYLHCSDDRHYEPRDICRRVVGVTFPPGDVKG